jgi:hypothetical protein
MHKKPSIKKESADRVAQMVEHLSSNCEDLSLNLRRPPKKIKTESHPIFKTIICHISVEFLSGSELWVSFVNMT